MANNELSKRVYVNEIKDELGLNQVTGDEESLKRWAIAPDINRPGLELSGYNDSIELKRVVVIGVKEQEYIKTMSYERQLDRFGYITDSYTPCIIVTAGIEVPKALIEVAKKKNFPVFSYPEKTYVLTANLTSFLSEKLAQTELIHGTMMNIFGVGVLIMGNSGIGKSELALDLIKRGHLFVADDVVEYARVHNEISCVSPKNLERMLEVRGIGILDVNYVFGAHCYLHKCNLDFVIKLVSLDEYTAHTSDRLSPSENKISLFGIEKTVLEIPITTGKTMAPIIEAAVTNYLLKKRGIDTTENFKQSILNEIKQKVEDKK